MNFLINYRYSTIINDNDNGPIIGIPVNIGIIFGNSMHTYNNNISNIKTIIKDKHTKQQRYSHYRDYMKNIIDLTSLKNKSEIIPYNKISENHEFYGLSDYIQQQE